MNVTLKSLVCRLLAVTLIMLPFQTGQAAMIGTVEAQAASTAQIAANAERSTVLNFLSRAQTVNEMQSMGLDPETARERVAAMTDAEVSTLAGKINAIPAGADGTVLAVVLVAALVWYFVFRK